MSLFVVMGVSGCGKSTVARELAEATHGDFLDADDFHPPSNRRKMTEGIPLQDSDRWGWLDLLNHELVARRENQRKTFLACSALRKSYRDRLSSGLPDLRFIYLQGSRECIARRMDQRKGHFMPPALMESQFATLEEPSPKEALICPVELPLDVVVASILKHIR